MLGRHIPQRRPQLAHPVTGQPVEDTGPITAGGDYAGPGHRPQVMRRIRHALADLRGDLLDRPLTLGEQIGDLRPPPAGQRLRHLGEGIEQRILSGPVTHSPHGRTASKHCQVFI